MTNKNVTLVPINKTRRPQSRGMLGRVEYLEITSLVAEGADRKAVADTYGVSLSTIHKLLRNTAPKHLAKTWGCPEHILDRCVPGSTPNSGCLEWAGCLNSGGYGSVRYGGLNWPAHRLVCCWTSGIDVEALDPDTDFVLHSCHNPKCCNPDHLRLGSPADNMNDRDDAGRQAMGERNGGAKLTEHQVLEIRRRLAGGGSGASLGREFGVCQTTISRIKLGHDWKHILITDDSTGSTKEAL